MSTHASTSPSTGGVLAVHAHPDDETLTSGALLATWAAAGLPALVVTCTRGERGEVIGAPLAHLEGDAPALAAHREHELAAATAALGAAHLFLDTLPSPTDPAERAPDVASGSDEPAGAARSADVVGERYEDSGMAWVGTGQAGSAGDPPARALVAADLDRAAGRLAVLLRERRPDLVVTYEPGGGYGHPDHVRAHELTMRAVALAADPAWPAGARGAEPWHVPGVLWAVTDPATLRAGYAALADAPAVRALLADRTDRRATREGPLVPPDPAGPLPSVAAAGRTVDVAVPVGPVRERVLAALRAHATQVQAVTALDVPGLAACYALSNLVLAPVPAAETYAWAPGHRAARPVWPAGVRAT
jgi:N-acetyl-1-D-myo-inositol-2-amino-2-deoxy-alpha-D-glucopyranoside deacetylase